MAFVLVAQSCEDSPSTMKAARLRQKDKLEEEQKATHRVWLEATDANSDVDANATADSTWDRVGRSLSLSTTTLYSTLLLIATRESRERVRRG